ncbi:hypothetical protein SNK04_005808 [Fusarium graminearum]
MKFSAAFVGLVGLAVASPFTEHDTSNGLVARGGKCDIPNKYLQYPSTPKPKKYYGYGRTIHVKRGQKIQNAIKNASPGDRIVVAAGDYREQLVIDKDGIQLEGHGANLIQPDAKDLKTNACTGLTQDPQKNKLQTGICIVGYNVKTDDFITEHKKVKSVGRPVKGVSVTGFTVNGFSGINIAILGAKNTYITNNKLVDGGAYGGLTLGSINTVFYDNVVTTTKGGFIAICMDNKSDVFSKKNDISNHAIGLCVQTNGAVLSTISSPTTATVSLSILVSGKPRLPTTTSAQPLLPAVRTLRVLFLEVPSGFWSATTPSRARKPVMDQEQAFASMTILALLRRICPFPLLALFSERQLRPEITWLSETLSTTTTATFRI